MALCHNSSIAKDSDRKIAATLDLALKEAVLFQNVVCSLYILRGEPLWFVDIHQIVESLRKGHSVTPSAVELDEIMNGGIKLKILPGHLLRELQDIGDLLQFFPSRGELWN